MPHLREEGIGYYNSIMHPSAKINLNAR